MRASKVDLRKRVLEAVGAPARVFDAFAGEGEMFRAVWRDATSYVGCDRRAFWDDRSAFVADNRRVLRAIDLQRFNIFDLDAYGSPWDQAIIVAARRHIAPTERIGVVLTEVSGLALKMGNLTAAWRQMAGIKGPVAAGLFRAQDDVLNAMVVNLARMMRCSVEKRWQATGKTGAAVRYVGLVLRGLEHSREDSNVLRQQ